MRRLWFLLIPLLLLVPVLTYALGALAPAARTVVDIEYSYALDDADLVVKASPGFVHTFTCWGEDAAATAGSVELRDAVAAGAGTVVVAETIAAAAYVNKTVTIDALFTTGIVIDFTTTADVFCVVSYR